MSTVKRPDDPHYKATFSVALHGAHLQFHVAQDLFSSAGLDPGTAALLRTLAGGDYAKVLDLGCGYGPLGLFLKAWDPAREVHLVDRDQLAVDYALANAAANGLAVGADQGLGYDDVEGGEFDLIVSNIPAKAGPAVIDSLLLDGAHFLAHGGRMAVVGITRLVPQIRATLERAAAEVLFERENRGYVCVQYRLPPPEGPYRPAFAAGAYDRGRIRYKNVEITTVHGLPEFDTSGFATLLALQLLPPGQLVVSNPGQGLLPAVASGRVAVDDRDLLAVRNTARNAVLTDEPADVAVALLREREPLAVTLADLGRHRTRRAVVAGTSTQVTRVVEATGADVVERRRKKGFSAALLEMAW